MTTYACATCGHGENWHSVMRPGPCMGFPMGGNFRDRIECDCPAYRAIEEDQP